MSGKRINTHSSARPHYYWPKDELNHVIDDDSVDNQYEFSHDFSNQLDSLEIIYENINPNGLSDSRVDDETRLLECIKQWQQIDWNNDYARKQSVSDNNINDNVLDSEPTIADKQTVVNTESEAQNQIECELNGSKIMDKRGIKCSNNDEIVITLNIKPRDIGENSENKRLCDTEPKLVDSNNCDPKPVDCSPKPDEIESGEIISSSDVEIIGVKLPPVKKKKKKKKLESSVKKAKKSGNKGDFSVINERKTLKKKNRNERVALKNNAICDNNNKQIIGDPRQKSTDKPIVVNNAPQKHENSTTKIWTPQIERLCACKCGTILNRYTNSRYCSERCIALSVEKALLMLRIADQNNQCADERVNNKRIAVVEKRSDGVLMGIEYIDEKNVFRYIVEHPNYEVFLPDFVKNRCDSFAQFSDSLHSNKVSTNVQSNKEKSLENCNKKVMDNNQKKVGEKVGEKVSEKVGEKYIEKVSFKINCPKRARIEKPNKIFTEAIPRKISKQTNARKYSTESYSRKYSPEKRSRKYSTESDSMSSTYKFYQQMRVTMEKMSNESEEQIRASVTKTIAEILVTRCNEANDICVEKRRIERIAEDVEKQLYRLYDRNTSDKYKNKYRSLMFNLKDKKNNHLFRQVVTQEIDAKSLVKMSAEELASQELAKWREKEKINALKIMTEEANYFYDKAVSKQKKKSLDVNINANVDQTIGGFQLVVNASYLSNSIPATNIELPKSVPKTVNVRHEVVDKILEENAKNAIGLAVTDEMAQNMPPSHRPQAFVPQLLTLWQGVILHESGKFAVNANKLTGVSVPFLQDELTDTMAVCGRVSPEIVYDYVREVMLCPNNEICVVMLDWNIEEKHCYDSFFEYFYQRCRYAVGKCIGKLVKNFYIIPVPRTGYVPNVFMLFNRPGLNNKFMEYLRSTQSNVLVGIIVTNVIQKSYTPPQPNPTGHQTVAHSSHISHTVPFHTIAPQVDALTNSVNNVNVANTLPLVNENYAPQPMDIDDDIEITATVVNTANNNHINNNKVNAAQSISSFKDPRLKTH